jgi:hypothetical protein
MSYCIYLIHMTVMTVINSQASYRVDISQVAMQRVQGTRI